MSYPLKQKIDERLDGVDKSKGWLKDELGISEKTLYNYKDISQLSLQMILKLSAALNFNFLEDYNTWLREHHEPAIASWSENEIEYKREYSETKMTLTFSVRGDQKTIGKEFSSMLQALKKECDSHGLELV